MTTIEPNNSLYYVSHSAIHGTGVFAAIDIEAERVLFEYIGPRISAEEADNRPPHDPSQPFHTFYFSLSNNMVIDGDIPENTAKWMNHSCNPNCQAFETEQEKIYIQSIRPISKGEELVFDYSLIIDEPLDEALMQQYKCECGHSCCRKTMLQLASP